MIKIEALYDAKTYTMTYVVFDPASKDAVLIDPVLDYDPASSQVSTDSVERAREFIDQHELHLHLILETHAHADHLSGAQLLKQHYPHAKGAIGRGITVVQRTFKAVFGLPDSFPTDGSQFDFLLKDGEITRAGTLEFETIATPGHTPACVTYRFEDALFTGDALFMPDMGTGRCDFPAGSATDLYRSIQKLYKRFSDETRVFVGHDYQPGGRELQYEATIADHKQNNVRLNESTTEEQFVSAREKRDAELSAPRLLFQSVQVNIDAGALPEPTDNEIRYLRIPINVFRPETEGLLSEEPISS